MKNSNSYLDEIQRLMNIAKVYNIDYNFNIANHDEYANIHKYVQYLRTQIMQNEFWASISRMKSPEFKKGKDLSKSYFSYERSYMPYSIETLITESFHTHKVSTLVTRSGLSSLDLAFRTSIYFLHSIKENLNSVSYYNYFETETLMQQMERVELIRNNNSTNFDKFINLILKCNPDIIFIENPLAIPKNVNFSEHKLLAAIRKLDPRTFRIIVFDSTLKGSLTNLESLLNKLPGNYLIFGY